MVGWRRSPRTGGPGSVGDLRPPVRQTGPGEEQVGETVQIHQMQRVGRLGVRERHHPPLRAAADGAGYVQRGGRGVPPGRMNSRSGGARLRRGRSPLRTPATRSAGSAGSRDSSRRASPGAAARCAPSANRSDWIRRTSSARPSSPVSPAALRTPPARSSARPRRRTLPPARCPWRRGRRRTGPSLRRLPGGCRFSWNCVSGNARADGRVAGERRLEQRERPAAASSRAGTPSGSVQLSATCPKGRPATVGTRSDEQRSAITSAASAPSGPSHPRKAPTATPATRSKTPARRSCVSMRSTR